MCVLEAIPQGQCFGWKGKVSLEGAGQDPSAAASVGLIAPDRDPPGHQPEPGRGRSRG